MSSTEPIRVTIFNQTYSLVSTEDGSDVHELAQTVDELMTSISRSGNLDSTRTAVLACLHLADQLRALQRDHDELRVAIADKAKHFNLLLDRLIE